MSHFRTTVPSPTITFYGKRPSGYTHLDYSCSSTNVRRPHPLYRDQQPIENCLGRDYYPLSPHPLSYAQSTTTNLINDQLAYTIPSRNSLLHRRGDDRNDDRDTEEEIEREMESEREREREREKVGQRERERKRERERERKRERMDDREREREEENQREKEVEKERKNVSEKDRERDNRMEWRETMSVSDLSNHHYSTRRERGRERDSIPTTNKYELDLRRIEREIDRETDKVILSSYETAPINHNYNYNYNTTTQPLHTSHGLNRGMFDINGNKRLVSDFNCLNESDKQSGISNYNPIKEDYRGIESRTERDDKINITRSLYEINGISGERKKGMYNNLNNGNMAGQRNEDRLRTGELKPSISNLTNGNYGSRKLGQNPIGSKSYDDALRELHIGYDRIHQDDMNRIRALEKNHAEDCNRIRALEQQLSLIGFKSSDDLIQRCKEASSHSLPSTVLERDFDRIRISDTGLVNSNSTQSFKEPSHKTLWGASNDQLRHYTFQLKDQLKARERELAWSRQALDEMESERKATQKDFKEACDQYESRLKYMQESLDKRTNEVIAREAAIQEWQAHSTLLENENQRLKEDKNKYSARLVHTMEGDRLLTITQSQRTKIIQETYQLIKICNEKMNDISPITTNLIDLKDPSDCNKSTINEEWEMDQYKTALNDLARMKKHITEWPNYNIAENGCATQ